MTGTITRVITERGFGFIKGDDGCEYFLHAKQLEDRSVWAALEKGQRVTFTPADNGTGGNKRRAVGVSTT